jgi:polar amino acid transport system substrate-binding protein
LAEICQLEEEDQMTTKRSRFVRLFAVLLAVGLLAAACGDDDDSGEAISGTDLGGRTVTVGVENAYLPFNYVPAGESEGQGWDYDAWREICRIANCEAEFVVAGWPAVIDQVAQGEEIVAYSQAYMTVDQKFIVGIDDDRFSNADDIINGDALIGTQVGTTNFELAESLLGGDDRISAFDQFGLAVQALVNGDVDAVIIDDAAGQGYVGENADAVKLVDDALQADPLGFIFPLDSELIPAVDAAIDEMRSSGFLDELGEKYFTDAFTVTYDDIEG